MVSLQDESVTIEKGTKPGYSNYTGQGFFFNLQDFLSESLNILETNATGFSLPSGRRCDKTAPNP